MSSKTVLLLGGSYFIGKRITETLIQAGYDVYTLNRGSRPKVHPSVHELIADRYDADAMLHALEGRAFSYVVDVSGLDRRQAANLTAALCPDQLKGFVFISSSAVYAMKDRAIAAPAPIPIPEGAPLGPNDYWGDYGINKVEAETHYQDWTAHLAGCPLAILRPPYVYGEYNYARRESWVFEHLRLGRPIILPPHNSLLQFIYTADLAQIVLRLLEAPRAGVFNVGNQAPISMRDWLLACGEAFGRVPEILPYPADGPIAAREYFPFHDYDNVLKVEQIRTIYNEETPMQVGLARACDWYAANRESIVFKPQMAELEDRLYRELL